MSEPGSGASTCIGYVGLHDKRRRRDVLHDVECLLVAAVVDMESEGHLGHVWDVVGNVETEGVADGDGLVCRDVLMLMRALCNLNVR